jgi:hypothetical protein
MILPFHHWTEWFNWLRVEYKILQCVLVFGFWNLNMWFSIYTHLFKVFVCLFFSSLPRRFWHFEVTLNVELILNSLTRVSMFCIWWNVIFRYWWFYIMSNKEVLMMAETCKPNKVFIHIRMFFCIYLSIRRINSYFVFLGLHGTCGTIRTPVQIGKFRSH